VPTAIFLLVAGFIITPSFVARHLSPDGVLGRDTIGRILSFQSVAASLGFLFAIGSAWLYKGSFPKVALAPLIIVYFLEIYAAYIEPKNPADAFLQFFWVKDFSTNLAVNASVTVSSERPATGQLGTKAIDGIVDGWPHDYTKEWATVGELGEVPNSLIKGAWIKLNWSYVTVSQVILHDRPNLDDHVLTGTLLFSDGSSLPVGALPNNGTGLSVLFPYKTVTWVKFRVDSAVGANIGLAEIEVFGQCAITPSVKIVQPANFDLRPSTTLSVSAQTCLDSSLHSGWGVRFTLDGGAANGGAEFDDYVAPIQGTFTNVGQSEHVIGAFIIDGSGNIVLGSATQDQIIRVGVGNYYVAMGDSITRGAGNDVPSDGISQDGRNAGGGYESILNDLLTNAKGYPHTVINEGVGGIRSIEGVSLIPSLLSRHPDAQYVLIELGTNDAITPVPSGLGLHPGDSGYPGTFKDNMQRIITSIKNAGKLPYLAKVPYSTGQYTARNLLYQAYNQVIEELVIENRISVVPPDFYSYFQSHQNQLPDGLHPNGIGNQAMANLWFQALP